MKRSILLTVIVSSLCLSLVGQKNVNITLEAAIPQGNILTNDVWGITHSDGTEYAIVGTRAEAIIYNIDVPSSPVEIARVPGASSVWRDFKSLGNVIYQTTDQGSDGLTIIDLSNAPDTVITKNITNIDGVNEPLRTCHNLWIDTLSGTAFLSGCNVGIGGALILDLTQDPLNPTFEGIQDQRYAHDLISRDTFLYASEINEGNLGIYSIADVENPVLLSRTQTTSAFTHNAWYSDDGNFIYTTDERENSLVDAYDISDPTNPILIDTYQPVENQRVIPHNVHVKNDFIIASWYGEGVIILDAQRPHNLIKVGQYDTDPTGLGGSTGCWGAFPFFESGTILASDLNNGFFVLSPTYTRASYLEGIITDANTGAFINMAEVTILGNELVTEATDAGGSYATGTLEEGNIRVAISHPDYLQDTVTATFVNGELTSLNVELVSKKVITISGEVLGENGAITNAQIEIQGQENVYHTTSDADGNFSIEVFDSPTFEIFVSAWGYSAVQFGITNARTRFPVFLSEGYEDDFFLDLGWTVVSDLRSGMWERGVPIATDFNGSPTNPGTDIPNDIGNQCYITGNGGGNAGFDDLDDGFTQLISPPIPIDLYPAMTIEFSAWFANIGGNTPVNDTLKVYVRTGSTDSLVMEILPEDEGGRWREGLRVKLGESFFDGDSIASYQVVFEASDLLPDGHVVEAGIDGFKVLNSATTSTFDLISDQEDTLTIFPNPVSDYLFFNSTNDLDIRALKIYDEVGRIVSSSIYTAPSIDISYLRSGIYFLHIESTSGDIIKRFSKL